MAAAAETKQKADFRLSRFQDTKGLVVVEDEMCVRMRNISVHSRLAVGEHVYIARRPTYTYVRVKITAPFNSETGSYECVDDAGGRHVVKAWELMYAKDNCPASAKDGEADESEYDESESDDDDGPHYERVTRTWADTESGALVSTDTLVVKTLSSDAKTHESARLDCIRVLKRVLSGIRFDDLHDNPLPALLFTVELDPETGCSRLVSSTNKLTLKEVSDAVNSLNADGLSRREYEWTVRVARRRKHDADDDEGSPVKKAKSNPPSAASQPLDANL